MLLSDVPVEAIIGKMFEKLPLFFCEDIMLQSDWFALTLLFLVLMTMVICSAVLYLVQRQSRADTATSAQVVQLLSKMSEQQVYITDRHEAMTGILATVSNEFLRLRQEKDC